MTNQIQDIVSIPNVAALRRAEHEHLLFIDSNTLHHVLIAVGDDMGVNAEEKDYLNALDTLQTRRVVLLHNHPTDENGKIQVRPSKKDWFATMHVKKVLNDRGVELVDHLVLSERAVFSYQFRRVFRLADL